MSQECTASTEVFRGHTIHRVAAKFRDGLARVAPSPRPNGLTGILVGTGASCCGSSIARSVVQCGGSSIGGRGGFILCGSAFGFGLGDFILGRSGFILDWSGSSFIIGRNGIFDARRLVGLRRRRDVLCWKLVNTPANHRIPVWSLTRRSHF